MSSESTSASPDRDGWQRLAADLAEVVETDHPVPAALKAALLQRIQETPARVETDARGGIVAINPAFTALCGYSFSELVGQKPGQMLQGPLSDPFAIALLRQAIADRDACETEVVNYHKDGSPYRVYISLSPIEDAAGQVTGFSAVEVKLPL